MIFIMIIIIMMTILLNIDSVVENWTVFIKYFYLKYDCILIRYKKIILYTFHFKYTFRKFYLDYI